MGRRIVCAAALAVLATLPLSAQDDYGAGGEGTSRISVWGGYASASMSDVNDSLAAAGGDVTKISGGFVFGADYLYELANRLFVGPRIEYVGLNRGKAAAGGNEVTTDLYLIPVMVGGRYYFMKDEGQSWNLSATVFAGVGLGYGKTSAGGTDTKYSGTGFASDLVIGGEYALSRTVSLGLDLGYRYAPVPEMSTSDGGGGGGGGGGYAPAVNKAVFKDPSGKTIKFDFSGLIATIGINCRF